MDKREVARWNRHLKIKKVRQDHAAVSVGALVQRRFARHDELVAAVQTQLDSPAGRTEGATRQKSAEETRVIAQVLPVVNALYLVYLDSTETDDKALEKAHALRRTKSDYTALPAALVLAEARNVARQAAPLAAKLAEANLDADDLRELNEAIAAFDRYMAAPQVSRASGKTSTSTLSAALLAADQFIKAELRPAVETLKPKQPAFYQALIEAMRIDDAPGARGNGDDEPTPPAGPKA